MKSVFFKFLTVATCTTLASVAWAQVRPSVEEVTSNPSNAVIAEDWGSGILEAMEAYLAADEHGNARGWRLGTFSQNPSGAYIGWGEASIQLPQSDVRYGRARLAAYITAYVNAMGDFTRTLGNEIAVDTLVRQFGDETSMAAMEIESTENFLRAVSDRLSTLSVAALDRGLERLGADPDQLPRYSREEKVLLSESLMTREIARRAAARLQGVRTLATFEDSENVGVLIIHHERLEALAQRILAGREVSQAVANVEGVLATVDSLSSSELIFQHGLRVVSDGAGNPVILSFGQASPAVSQSDSRQAIRTSISQARQVAEAQADAAIAEFLNATVFSNVVVNVRASEFEIAERVGRNMLTTQGNQFFDDINSMIRQTARAEVTGITSIRRWQANHPDIGHLYVGVVRMWTPSQNFTYSAQQRRADAGTRSGFMRAGNDEISGSEEQETDGNARVRQSRELFRED